MTRDNEMSGPKGKRTQGKEPREGERPVFALRIFSDSKGLENQFAGLEDRTQKSKPKACAQWGV